MLATGGFLLLALAAVSAGRQPYIIGGDEVTEAGKWSPTCSLQYGSGHWCTASLIAKDWVLTAAHCIFDKEAKDFSVMCGVLDHHNKNVGRMEQSAIDYWVFHKDYQWDFDRGFPNDVAVMKLKVPMDLSNPYIKIAKLSDDFSYDWRSHECYATGWGKTVCTDKYDDCRIWHSWGECENNRSWMLLNCGRSCGLCGEGANVCADYHNWCAHWASIGECSKNPAWMHITCAKSCKKCAENTVGNEHPTSPNQLREAKLNIISQSDCIYYWGDSVLKNHICAKDMFHHDKGTCNGDSGGPLYCKRDGEFYQVGVFNWMSGNCHPYWPAMYSSVAAYRDWIKQHSGV